MTSFLPLLFRQTFPVDTRQILSNHSDEVWFCQFSHSGRFLATASKDASVIIWEMDSITKRFKQRPAFDGHTYGASFVAWSPDDRYLAVVGQEDGPDMWIWDVEVRILLDMFVESSKGDTGYQTVP